MATIKLSLGFTSKKSNPFVIYAGFSGTDRNAAVAAALPDFDFIDSGTLHFERRHRNKAKAAAPELEPVSEPVEPQPENKDQSDLSAPSEASTPQLDLAPAPSLAEADEDVPHSDFKKKKK